MPTLLFLKKEPVYFFKGMLNLMEFDKLTAFTVSRKKPHIFFLNNMIKEKFTRELSTVYLKEIIFYPSYNGFNDKVTYMYYLFIKTDFLL